MANYRDRGAREKKLKALGRKQKKKKKIGGGWGVVGWGLEVKEVGSACFFTPSLADADNTPT